MKRFAILCLLTVAAVPSLHAQGGTIWPEKPLDAEHARVRDALLMLRDTLLPAKAAIARLERDFGRASGAALTSHARLLADACVAIRRNLAPARQAIVSAPADTRLKRREQARVQGAIDRLGAQVSKCVAEFTPLGVAGKGEEVRGYANRRAHPLDVELAAYDRAVVGFFNALDIPYRPLGARPNPLAG